MFKTFVEIVQPRASAVIDVRVCVTTTSGAQGVRVWAFDSGVSFDEILKRIGCEIGPNLEITLRADYGSPLRRQALRMTGDGRLNLESDSPARESTGDAVQAQTDREHLKRCYAKEIWGQ